MVLNKGKIKLALNHKTRRDIWIYFNNFQFENSNDINDLVELIKYYKDQDDKIFKIFKAAIQVVPHWPFTGSKLRPEQVKILFDSVVPLINWPALESIIDFMLPLSIKYQKEKKDLVNSFREYKTQIGNENIWTLFDNAMQVYKYGRTYYNFDCIVIRAIVDNQINIIYKLRAFINERQHYTYEVMAIHLGRYEIYSLLTNSNKPDTRFMPVSDSDYMREFYIHRAFETQNKEIIKKILLEYSGEEKFRSTEYFYALKLNDKEILDIVRNKGYDLYMSIRRSLRIKFVPNDFEIQKQMFEEYRNSAGFEIEDFIVNVYNSIGGEQLIIHLMDLYPIDYFNAESLYSKKWSFAIQKLAQKSSIFSYVARYSSLKEYRNVNNMVYYGCNFHYCLPTVIKLAKQRINTIPYGSSARNMIIFRRNNGAGPAFASLLEMYCDNFDDIISTEREKIDETMRGFGCNTEKMGDSDLLAALKDTLAAYRIE